MSNKITLLKNGERLISDMKEIVAEGKEDIKAYLLQNPHTYEINEKQFITEDEKKDISVEIMDGPLEHGMICVDGQENIQVKMASLCTSENRLPNG